MIVYINRGLPGSGKSTRALRIAGEHDCDVLIVSADDYFVVNGVYRFDMSNIGAAHMECQQKFREGVREKAPVIIVDNTNTTIREMRPYVEYAHIRGYEVVLLEPDTAWAWDIDACLARNVHGVPREALERMKA